MIYLFISVSFSKFDYFVSQEFFFSDTCLSICLSVYVQINSKSTAQIRMKSVDNVGGHVCMYVALVGVCPL